MRVSGAIRFRCLFGCAIIKLPKRNLMIKRGVPAGARDKTPPAQRGERHAVPHTWRGLAGWGIIFCVCGRGNVGDVGNVWWTSTHPLKYRSVVRKSFMSDANVRDRGYYPCVFSAILCSCGMERVSYSTNRLLLGLTVGSSPISSR